MTGVEAGWKPALPGSAVKLTAAVLLLGLIAAYQPGFANDSEKNNADPFVQGGISEAFKALDSGDAAKALELFNAHARKNPTSPQAHFGRARSLSKLGRQDEAAKEFKLTLLLEPGEAIAKKCRDELGIKKDPSAATVPPPVPSNSSSPGTVRAKDVESSISKILTQSEEKIKTIHSGSESYANHLYNSHSNQHNKAMERAKQEADEMRRSIVRGGRGRGMPAFSEADIRERQAELQFKATTALSRARADYESRKREAETRALGVKESAEGLESQMVTKPSESSGIFLMPEGTNLYVRNYGHFDPVLPEPPEALHAVPLKLPQVLKMQEEMAKKKSRHKKNHSNVELQSSESL